MTIYSPTTWTDEVPATSPIKYKITPDTGSVIEHAKIELETSVTSGTPLVASNLNKMETGIYNAHAAAIAAQATADAAAITNTKADYLYALRSMPIFVPLNGSTALTTNDKALLIVPLKLNGGVLSSVKAACVGASSSGTVTLTVKKRTGAGAWATMLSTNITMEAGQMNSIEAAVQPAIGANNGLVTNDQILIEVSGAGTGVTFCGVEPTFLPAA